MSKIVVAALLTLSLVGAASAADRSAGQVIDDAKIAMLLKSKLVADKVGNLTKTDVTVKQGIVTLDGTVHTEEQKRHAEEVARRIDGVKEVHNNLKVASSPSASPGSK